MCEIKNNINYKNLATGMLAPNVVAKNNEKVKNTTKLSYKFEDSFDDGKISFKAKAYYFVAGMFKPAIEMFKSPKNFLMGLAISAGIGVASFFTPITAIMATLGLLSGISTLYKGAKAAKNAKTDKEAQESWEKIGLGSSVILSSLNLPKLAKKHPRCDVIEPKDKMVLEKQLASYFGKNPKNIDPQEISKILSKMAIKVTEPDFIPSNSCKFGRKKAFYINLGKNRYRMLLETHSTKGGGWVTRLYDDAINGVRNEKFERSYIEACGHFIEDVYKSSLTHLSSGNVGKKFVLSA